MRVYVITGQGIETGTFQRMENSTVQYRTPDGIKWEHTRNVYFTERKARYHYLRSLGITRPILNGAR